MIYTDPFMIIAAFVSALCLKLWLARFIASVFRSKAGKAVFPVSQKFSSFSRSHCPEIGTTTSFVIAELVSVKERMFVSLSNLLEFLADVTFVISALLISSIHVIIRYMSVFSISVITRKLFFLRTVGYFF